MLWQSMHGESGRRLARRVLNDMERHLLSRSCGKRFVVIFMCSMCNYAGRLFTGLLCLPSFFQTWIHADGFVDIAARHQRWRHRDASHGRGDRRTCSLTCGFIPHSLVTCALPPATMAIYALRQNEIAEGLIISHRLCSYSFVVEVERSINLKHRYNHKKYTRPSYII